MHVTFLIFALEIKADISFYPNDQEKCNVYKKFSKLRSAPGR
jgi:hypothetical protein